MWVYFGDFGFGCYVGVISDFGDCVWFGLFGFDSSVCLFDGVLRCDVIQVYGDFGLIALSRWLLVGFRWWVAGCFQGWCLLRICCRW